MKRSRGRGIETGRTGLRTRPRKARLVSSNCELSGKWERRGRGAKRLDHARWGNGRNAIRKESKDETFGVASSESRNPFISEERAKGFLEGTLGNCWKKKSEKGGLGEAGTGEPKRLRPAWGSTGPTWARQESLTELPRATGEEWFLNTATYFRQSQGAIRSRGEQVDLIGGTGEGTSSLTLIPD